MTTPLDQLAYLSRHKAAWVSLNHSRWDATWSCVIEFEINGSEIKLRNTDEDMAKAIELTHSEYVRLTRAVPEYDPNKLIEAQ